MSVELPDLALEQEEVQEEQQQELVQEEVEGDAQPEEEAQAETEEVVVTIGDEPLPEEETEQAPSWVRELRKTHRETVRENRELKEKLSKVGQTADTAPAVEKKPTLEGCDYDAEVFERQLTAWHDAKRKADEAEAKKRAEQDAENAAWQEKLKAYGESKTQLKVKDFEDAEAVILDSFSVVQQGIVVKGADNPALLVYALGKNPKKAKELAEIKDPVKFSFAVAKLEAQLKVTNRKAPPAPERTVSGSAPKSGSVDSTLERLRAEAERTGDMSKLMAYKRQLKQKQ
jgi:hypothetical protein